MSFSILFINPSTTCKGGYLHITITMKNAEYNINYNYMMLSTITVYKYNSNKCYNALYYMSACYKHCCKHIYYAYNMLIT